MKKQKKTVRKDSIIPDALWKEIEPLIPVHRPPKHPLGMTRPRVLNRAAMNAIFFVLKTGCQWNALNETGICSSSSAHRRFQEWTKKGVFKKIWKHHLEKYDALQGIDWSFCSTDGAMTKAPLGGEKIGKNPMDRAKLGTKHSLTWRCTQRCSRLDTILSRSVPQPGAHRMSLLFLRL